MHQIEAIEDATQEAFLRAMKLWGFERVPDNPTAWLLTVARNQLLDSYRKNRKSEALHEHSREAFVSPDEVETPALAHEISDSQLRMIFACCHPALSTEQQIILSLKLIGGFSNKELAEALLKKEETVAKAFTRAKRKLREHVQQLEAPIALGLQSRKFVVFRVIYLLFSEGYATTEGAQAIKQDICYEAIRLALLLHENTHTSHPNLKALIALMCFHAARFDARMDSAGNVMMLEEQDRNLYNQELIAIGIRHLEHAGTVDGFPSNYHLEAAVSYHHSVAKTFEETDWKAILNLYNLQVKNFYTPTVALHQIIPLLEVEGVVPAKEALQAFQQKHPDKLQTLFHAISAEVALRAQERDTAKAHLQQAIETAESLAEKNFLIKKLKVL